MLNEKAALDAQEDGPRHPYLSLTPTLLFTLTMRELFFKGETSRQVGRRSCCSSLVSRSSHSPFSRASP